MTRFRSRLSTTLTALSLALGVLFGHARAEELILALTPSRDPTLLQAAGGELAAFLSGAIGVKVKAVVASDYTGVVEGLRSKNVDLAFIHSVGYVLAAREANARIIVKSLRDGLPDYASRIFVLKKSGIKSLEELRGKTIAFVDPTSGSGYIYPLVLFMKRGLVKNKDPKTFFRNMVFAGAHDAALLAVLNGSVDAAAAFDHAPERLLKDPARVELLTHIAETPRIPNDGACVREGLAPEMVEKIRQALLRLNGPQGKPLLKKLYSIDGLAPAAHEDYAPVAEAMSLLGLPAK
jgi:phosphonate transport system substrate-binding protein